MNGQQRLLPFRAPGHWRLNHGQDSAGELWREALRLVERIAALRFEMKSAGKI